MMESVFDKHLDIELEKIRVKLMEQFTLIIRKRDFASGAEKTKYRRIAKHFEKACTSIEDAYEENWVENNDD